MITTPAPRLRRALRGATQFALFCVLLGVSAAPARAAEWFESYHLAEEALEREQWSEALRELNSALEQRPNSGSRVRTYGMRFIDYYPFLKLGIAYYHLGQHEAALQALETERRQGEINRSAAQLALLQEYQGRIEQADRQSADDRERQRARILADSLDAARELERQNRLDEALAALDRGLAVVPDDVEAQSVQRRLFALLAEQKNEQQRRLRFNRFVERGKTQLSSRQYGPAAASFSEALELETDAAVAELLALAQARLRGEVAQQDASAQRRRLDEAYRRAAELAKSGAGGDALAELQLVLAVDANHQGAVALQARILREQALAAESETRAETIARLLDRSERALNLGEHDRALQAANGVLVIDSSNAEALRLVTLAYGRLSSALLANEGSPPTIVAEREGTEAATEVVRRTVRSPSISISGTVYDRGPVEILVYQADEVLGPAVVEARELRDLWISDFVYDTSVEPGISQLEIVAIDAEGNRATLPYEVAYLVPFHRSSWFLGTIVLGVMALTLTVVAARGRRRRKLLRKRFNPYVAGAPILEHSRFFGREQLLEYVLRRISNNSIMLYGERRIGKTSFQHQLKRCLESLEDAHYKFFPVYVDLQGTPEESFFATLAAEIFHGLEAQLGGLEPQTDLDGGRYGYRELVKDLHAVIRVLRARTSKKVKLVLLIDEVDELNDYDPRVNQRLRSLFMRALSDSLVAVVSGVAIKKQWEREGSPWYNFFQEIEVAPLDRDEAHSLIEAPVRGVFTFEDGVAEEIIRRTESKPYLIQRLCSGLVERMHEEGRRSITVADVDASYQAEAV